ncbi:MAG: TIGR02444 family protein [Caulobacter sp.]|nr:TIGR02444 family protein [Caulobacter sp.]
MSTNLWDWTLAAYGKPGAPEAALALQDEHGLNTAFLLWAVWANPDRETLANGVQTTVLWDETVLWPLRNVRRALKAGRKPFDDAAREGLREDVKAAELRAERVLMETLETLGGPADQYDPAGALNRAAMAWSGQAPAEALKRLAQALA